MGPISVKHGFEMAPGQICFFWQSSAPYSEDFAQVARVLPSAVVANSQLWRHVLFLSLFLFFLSLSLSFILLLSVCFCLLKMVLLGIGVLNWIVKFVKHDYCIRTISHCILPSFFCIYILDILHAETVKRFS